MPTEIDAPPTPPLPGQPAPAHPVATSPPPWPPWRLCILALLVALFMGLSYWIAANPGPINWDNAEYLNTVYQDSLAYHTAGLPGYVHSWLYNNRYRTPGFRLIAMPLVLADSVNITSLRYAALAGFALTLWLLYRAVSIVTTESAGLLAATLFALLPIVDSARSFGTETPLYLALAATLYFLFHGLTAPRLAHREWIGLGLAIGLGALAKLSYPWIAGPMLLVVLILSFFRKAGPWRFYHLLASHLLGLAVALTWYWFNLRQAWALARVSQGFDRSAMGRNATEALLEWFKAMHAWAFGGPICYLAIGLAALVLAVAAYRLYRPTPVTIGHARLAIILCILGAVVFPFIQLRFSTNHDLRVASPFLVPAVAALALAAGHFSLTRSRILLALFAVLLVWQFATVNIRTFAQTTDIWDWNQLYTLCAQRHIKSPTIVHLGNLAQLNTQIIISPWVRRGQVATHHWLWRYEQGPIDWAKILDGLKGADVVLVGPNIRGLAIYKEDVDNQHNPEFDARMKADPRFDPPLTLTMGTIERTDLHVYFRHPPATAPTRPATATSAPASQRSEP